MMEERYHATTQNRFYPDMSNVNENITGEAKLISPPVYVYIYIYIYKAFVSKGFAKQIISYNEY